MACSREFLRIYLVNDVKSPAKQPRALSTQERFAESRASSQTIPGTCYNLPITCSWNLQFVEQWADLRSTSWFKCEQAHNLVFDSRLSCYGGNMRLSVSCTRNFLCLIIPKLIYDLSMAKFWWMNTINSRGICTRSYALVLVWTTYSDIMSNQWRSHLSSLFVQAVLLWTIKPKNRALECVRDLRLKYRILCEISKWHHQAAFSS